MSAEMQPGVPLRAHVAHPAADPPIVVTSSADSGTGSLRAAIGAASSGDTIIFATGLGTITLASALAPTVNLTIQGPAGGLQAISGGGVTRIFSISSGLTLTLADLSITDGQTTTGDPAGGGIKNDGTLTLTGSAVTGNRTANGSAGVGDQGN
ncbi:MAG: hypothetical protein ACRDGS_13450, partial [Chloroflexota bacterium]